METWRVRFGAKKKTCLLNGLGPSNKGGPAGRVRVSKNPVWTQPIAIPIVTKQNIYYLEQNIVGGQLIPYVQIALERAGPNTQSHMYKLH